MHNRRHFQAQIYAMCTIVTIYKFRFTTLDTFGLHLDTFGVNTLSHVGLLALGRDGFATTYPRPGTQLCIYIYIYIYISAGPFRGHQAARRIWQTDSPKSPQSFQ